MTYTPWMRYTVGIEMEMNCRTTRNAPLNGPMLADAIRPVATRPVTGDGTGYRCSPGTAWDVKYDSTSGLEVASPAISFDANGESAELKAVCDAIAGLRPSIDEKCGLHVSVFCRDFTWKNLQALVALWSHHESNFFALLPDSRQSNYYCKPLRESSVFSGNSEHWATTQRAIKATNEREFRIACQNIGKYSAVRLDDWWMKGRVEFRLHSGTVDYTKIRNFALLVTAMVERVIAENAPRVAVTIPRPRAAVRKGWKNEVLLERLGLLQGWQQEPHEKGAVLLAYMAERRARFLTPRARAAGRLSGGAR